MYGQLALSDDTNRVANAGYGQSVVCSFLRIVDICIPVSIGRVPIAKADDAKAQNAYDVVKPEHFAAAGMNRQVYVAYLCIEIGCCC